MLKQIHVRKTEMFYIFYVSVYCVDYFIKWTQVQNNIYINPHYFINM